MNVLESWIRTPLAEGLGWTLFHFLWEGTVIAMALAAVLVLCRPSSPRLRYAMACLTMLLMPVAFAVTLLVSIPSESTGVLVSPPSGPVPEIRILPGPVPVAWTGPLWKRVGDRLPWIVPLWMAGVLIVYARTLSGWMAAQQLRRSGARPAPAFWQERLGMLAGRLHVSRTVVLLKSWLVDAPVVIGFLRPAILLPVSALTGLPPTQLEAILTHELAHIRRHDYVVNLVQTLVEGLLFYHPAVWWVSTLVRTERENCCDDAAVAVCGDAHGYAAALAALEQKRWPAGEPALAATGGKLMQRIRRLLKQSDGPRPAVAPLLAATLLLVLVGVALAAWQPQQAPALPKPPAPFAVPAYLKVGDGFAIFVYGDEYLNGWYNNADRDQAVRYGKSKEFIWLRRNGKTYIVRDADTLRRACEFYPDRVEREKQAELRQALVAEMDRLAARVHRLEDRTMTQAELTDIQAGLVKLRARLDELQARLAQTRVLEAAERADLGAQVSDQIPRIWQLLDEAIARGLAEPIPEK